LDFTDLEFFSEMIEEDEIKLQKEMYRSSAFSAWLTGAGGKNKTFNSYLNDIGLGERPAKISKEEKEKIIQKALEEDKKNRELFAKGYVEL
jgi:hypothetical protein